MRTSVLYETRTDASFIAANGTVVRFQDYLEGIKHALIYFAERRMLPVDDLLNAAQDVAMHIWEIRETLTPGCAKDCFRYGHTAMVNRVRDAWRAASRGRGGVPFSEMYPDTDGDGPVQSVRIAGYRGDEFEADAAVRMEETEMQVRKAMETLGEGYREILRMYLDGYTREEMAEELHLGRSVVHTRLCRAKAALRRALGEDFPEGSPEGRVHPQAA